MRIVKDDDDQVIVSLYEDILLDNESRDKTDNDKKEEDREVDLEESEPDAGTNRKTTDNQATSKT